MELKAHLNALKAVGHHGDEHVQKNDYREDVEQSPQAVAHYFREVMLPYFISGRNALGHDDIRVLRRAHAVYSPEQGLQGMREAVRFEWG